MNRNLYAKLAKSGIEKNKKIYRPFNIATTTMLTIFFIILAMASNHYYTKTGFQGMKLAQEALGVGSFVVALFAVIFILYAHTLLLKHRRKELALYQVLGMEKKHLRKVIFHEISLSWFYTTICALFIGSLLYKVTEAVLSKLTKTPMTPMYFPETTPYFYTCLLSIGIFILLYIGFIVRIYRIEPIKFLKETSAGEKEPKANRALAFFSVVVIGGGYYLSLTTKGYFDFVRFVQASLLVTLGTIAGFTALSVFVLKKLKQNKKFYYTPHNFTFISGLIGRMAKNGVSLGLVAIVSTSVIIFMVSSIGIYIGAQHLADEMVAHDIMLRIEPDYFEETVGKLKKTLNQEHLNIQEISAYRKATAYARLDNGKYVFEGRGWREDNQPALTIQFVNGNDLENFYPELKAGEAYLIGDEANLPKETVNWGNLTWHIVPKPDNFRNIFPEVFSDTVIIIVKNRDSAQFQTEIKSSCPISGGFMDIDFTNASAKETSAIAEKLAVLSKEKTSKFGNVTTKEIVIQTYYGVYGGIVFCGVFLGALFLVCLALLIYYKQLTEGYEDIMRFGILRRVGLKKEEIKNTIRKQVLAVFTLPVFVAMVHAVFAYPFIKTLFVSMRLSTKDLLFGYALTAVIFILLYTLTYLLTSKVYYGVIVPEKD